MNDVWDLVIVGAGPSALTAAIYAGRAGLRTLVIEKQLIGGQVATIDKIDNYPGFPDGVDGLTLAQSLEAQARRFGATIRFGEVTGLVKQHDGTALVNVDNGDAVARAVLIATGSRYRHLDIPGEKENYGRGVHYCATCDGALYRGKEIITVGGANTAVQEALFLAQFANHITMLVRSWIKADQILKDKLNELIQTGKITLMEGWYPVEVVTDDDKVVGVTAASGSTTKLIKADGVFVFAGVIPNTDFLHNTVVKLSDSGLVITDNQLQTTIPSVWAAGDVRDGATKQIVSAAGEGATAVINIGKKLRGISG